MIIRKSRAKQHAQNVQNIQYVDIILVYIRKKSYLCSRFWEYLFHKASRCNIVRIEALSQWRTSGEVMIVSLKYLLSHVFDI